MTLNLKNELIKFEQESIIRYKYMLSEYLKLEKNPDEEKIEFLEEMIDNAKERLKDYNVS